MAIGVSYHASAAPTNTFDFQAVADGSPGGTYYGLVGGERGAEEFIFTGTDGVTLTATGVVDNATDTGRV
jgi:hypothetical protein